MRRHSLVLLALVCCASAALTATRQIHAQPTDSLPTGAQLASGAQAQPPAEAEQQQQQQPQLLLAQRALNSSSSSAVAAAPAGSSLQAHLNGFQAQAQRQISQLDGLMLSGVNRLAPLAAHAANLTGAGAKYGNVLEVLSNVGRAIHQQIVSGGGGAATGSHQVQIVTAPNSAGKELLAGNSKKNEYQPIEGNQQQQQQQQAGSQDQRVQLAAPVQAGNATSAQSYREQSEQLRQDIVRRAGQLQQVVASSMEVLKNNGDLIVRRLLEQLNGRLDQAKAKADKIINEPAVNEVAIKALTTINQGLNNLNNIITNIVNRLDINAKDVNTNLAAVAASAAAAAPAPLARELQQRGSTGPADQSRFKLNFHQLGQQFSSAINAVQQQQRQMQLQQRAQQTNNLASAGGNNLKLAAAAAS